jgi:hypothetical protein
VGLTSISKKKNNGLLKNKLKIILLLVFISNITITSLKATPISRDVEITLLTPFGTPMAGAKVLVTMQDGTQLIATADTLGKIIVHDAPGGKVNIRVLSWRNMPINYVAENVATGTVIVENIGQLIVYVCSTTGVGISGARVEISNGQTKIISWTDMRGILVIELPSGEYSIKASRGGRESERDASVSGGETTEVYLPIDIFITIGGYWDLNSSEFLGLLFLLSVLFFLIYIIIKEYTVYLQRKRSRILKHPYE